MYAYTRFFITRFVHEVCGGLASADLKWSASLSERCCVDTSIMQNVTYETNGGKKSLIKLSLGRGTTLRT